MVVVKDHQHGSHPWGDITTIGLDLAKNAFQVHAVDEAGSVVVRAKAEGSSEARAERYVITSTMVWWRRQNL
jgi:hypothetical protein